eukprot:1636710-Ditylum_brightwellii.AAC.1
MLLDEDDLKGARLKCSPNEATAAKNMCIAMWKSFACPIKTAMQMYADNNEDLSAEPEVLGFNIDKFCNYAVKTLKTLCYAGGDDTQASLKLYEALTSSKVDAFNSDIRAYKAAVSVK